MEAIVPMLQDIGIAMAVKSLESAAFFPAYPEVAVVRLRVAVVVADGRARDLQRDPERGLQRRPPRPDRGVQAWQSSANDAQLKAAALKAQLIWAQKLPKIPIVTRNDIWVNNTKVHGWRPTQTMLYPQYNDVWLEK